MRLVLTMILLVSVLAPIRTLLAQGTSYIGLCNKTWDCSKTLLTWKRKPIVTGWLEDSFGTECKCADIILNQSKDKIIRVHLANGPCLRNKRCQRKDVFYGYTIASANRAAKVTTSRLRKRLDVLANRLKQRLEQSKGALTCYVSPCLECDLNEHARKAFIDSVSAVLPGCIIVDNPLRASCIRGTICERHGIDPNLTKSCIADLDGTEAESDLDLKEFATNTNNCELRFYWSSWMNCNSGEWRPPHVRVCNNSINAFIEAGRIAWSLSSSR